MTTIDLAGAWTLRRCRTGETHAAIVPGCTHDDLYRAGAIPDLWWRDNEASLLWVGEEEWQYEREIEVPEGADLARAELICEGLDTIAEVRVNDVLVLQADNMYRTWRCTIGSVLQIGVNRIAVRFASPLPAMVAGDRRKRLPAWNIYREEFWGRSYVRKMACAFGWDWGPIQVSAGIWRPLRIELPHQPRLTALAITQVHGPDAVSLQVSWEVEAPIPVHVRVVREHRVIAEITVAAATCAVELAVSQPELWWPTGLGAQPLYDVQVESLDGSSMQHRRIGLRTLELVRERDAIGESFCFAVNGLRFFAKGANWVPHRLSLAAVTEADYRRLVGDAAEAGMNMLRVWGGGLYELDAFYDACDEAGVLVWQDCAFACGVYPLEDPVFRSQVQAEIADNVQRLRHRASLALWCGNNELEMGFAGLPEMPWDRYTEFFDQLLPAWIRAFDSATPYIPGSPHTPVGDRRHSGDDRSGDAHHWSVWFGNDPFEKQRSWRCRFQSEYGFQSFPDRRCIASFTDPADRTLNSRILDYHQRSQMGNRTIFSYGLDWFPCPEGLDAQVHVSQLTQSTCVRYAAEHLRRLQPTTQGCLFWQINDLWPCASWSAMDADLRWKVLMYEAKRFFAPVLVSLCEDAPARTVAVHLSSHLPQNQVFAVAWRITDTDGRELAAGRDEVLIPAQSDRRVRLLDLAPHLVGRLASDVLVWAEAILSGEVVSRNLVSLARYKHLSLRDPRLQVAVGGDDGAVHVEVAAESPALYVRLDLAEADAWWSDNHLHLQAGERRRIHLRRGPDLATVRAQLRVTSLADLMPDRRSADAELAPLPEGYALWEKR